MTARSVMIRLTTLAPMSGNEQRSAFYVRTGRFRVDRDLCRYLLGEKRKAYSPGRGGQSPVNATLCPNVPHLPYSNIETRNSVSKMRKSVMRNMNRLAGLTLATSLIATVSCTDVSRTKTLKEQIVGTWSYVSVDTVQTDGSRQAMYGADPRTRGLRRNWSLYSDDVSRGYGQVWIGKSDGRDAG